MHKHITTMLLSTLLCVSCARSTYAMSTTSTTVVAPTRATTVLQVGDSLTAFSQWTASLQYKDAGYKATIKGYPGTALATPNTKEGDVQWLDYLPQLVRSVNPDVVVVELGTNDAFRGTDAETFAIALDKAMAIIGNRPVYWVNVAATCSVWPNIHNFGMMLNEIINLAKWHDNLHVVDMDKAMCAHSDLYRADKMHYNWVGEVIYAHTIVSAIQ